MPTIQFKGKTAVQNYHLTVPYKVLCIDEKKSLSKKTSLNDNLIIHGDNLSALKALLPLYANKIKCIYIDPPYNTGNENWVYNDNVNSPMIQEWLGNIVDKEDMTRHDKWLCMMMPRLKLLRELLSEDGIIFISCDDNENYHLRCILNEIFNENNFVANITINANPRGRQSDKHIANVHDTLLVYAKDSKFVELFGLSLNEEDINDYNKTDENGEKWRELGLRQRGSDSNKEDREEMFYPIYVNPTDSTVSLKKTKTHNIPVYPKKSDGRDGRWMWGMEKTSEEIERVYARNIARRNEYDIFIKDYLFKNGSMRRKKAKSIWIDKDVNTESGGKLLRQILPKSNFPYPKPLGLINKIIELSTDKNAIILDSFAGSGTTAHSVLEINSKDGGNRKFILIEQEDYINKITAERIRRIIKGYNSNPPISGSFTFVTLGAEVTKNKLLEGKNLPKYEQLADYVFYTLTGNSIDKKSINKDKWFIGKSGETSVYMIYEPKLNELKQIALTLNTMNEIKKHSKKQKTVIFAPAKYVDDETLKQHNIIFCQLPFEIYRMVK